MTERHVFCSTVGIEFSVEQIDRIARAVDARIQNLYLRDLTGISNHLPKAAGYAGIPWKNAGSTRNGVSCSGLVWLWHREQNKVEYPAPELPGYTPMHCEPMPQFKPTWDRGDVVFFRFRKTGQILHCAVCLGGGKFLHVVKGHDSRIETGLKLINRLGWETVGALTPSDAWKFYCDIAAYVQRKAKS